MRSTSERAQGVPERTHPPAKKTNPKKEKKTNPKKEKKTNPKKEKKTNPKKEMKTNPKKEMKTNPKKEMKTNPKKHHPKKDQRPATVPRMTELLDTLVQILSLERIEENIFRGQSQDLGWGRVFGGQVVGQALSAAEQTVPEGRSVHSLHGYFLRPGDAKKPIVFTVDPIRDGKSFTTRRVVAVQDGKAIFSLASSFQIDEGGFDHQSDTMPAVVGPEELMSEQELGRRYLSRLPESVLDNVPAGIKERAVADRPIEVRPIDPVDPMRPGVRPPKKQVWFRANGALPERSSVHQYLLAYASDFHLLGSAMLPHDVSWLNPRIQVASLDHAMWFHRPFRFDDWLLYDIDSPSAQGARGLARGRWFTRDGVLVASTAQEGLIRDRR